MKRLIILFLIVSAPLLSQRTIHNNTVSISETGVISGDYIGAAAQLIEQDTTVTTLADTWYRLEGTFNNFFMEFFSIENDTLTYNNGSYWFRILGQIVISSDTPNTTAVLGISINGEDPEYAQTPIPLKTADVFVGTSIPMVLMLEHNDKIVIVLKSDKIGAELIVQNVFIEIERAFL